MGRRHCIGPQPLHRRALQREVPRPLPVESHVAPREGRDIAGPTGCLFNQLVAGRRSLPGPCLARPACRPQGALPTRPRGGRLAEFREASNRPQMGRKPAPFARVARRRAGAMARRGAGATGASGLKTHRSLTPPQPLAHTCRSPLLVACSVRPMLARDTGAPPVRIRGGRRARELDQGSLAMHTPPLLRRRSGREQARAKRHISSPMPRLCPSRVFPCLRACCPHTS